MALTYNNTPLATQIPSSSQPLIQTNFLSINTLVGIDHESFASNNYGYHRGIHIVDGAIDPALIAGQVGLYVSANDLFVQKGVGSASNITELVGNATQGSTKTPAGLILKWGRGSTNGSGLASVTFTSAFATIFQVRADVSVISGTNSSSADNIARVYAYTNTGFSLVTYFANTARTRVTSEYVWFALGI